MRPILSSRKRGPGVFCGTMAALFSVCALGVAVPFPIGLLKEGRKDKNVEASRHDPTPRGLLSR